MKRLREWWTARATRKLERNAARFGARPGYDALWLWFGLSRASWLALPRVLMHEMPDDWQARMAQLLHEWEDAWDPVALQCLQSMRVGTTGRNGRFTSLPEWLAEYRHPNQHAIAGARRNK
jgi:hypothetical protein